MLRIDEHLERSLEEYARDAVKAVGDLTTEERQQAFLNYILAGRLEEPLPAKETGPVPFAQKTGG